MAWKGKGEQDYTHFTINIPMLTCLKVSLCMLLLPVEATVEPVPDTSASCISDSLNALRDPEQSCENPYSCWPSCSGSWKLEEGVAPSGRLWDTGWLCIYSCGCGCGAQERVGNCEEEQLAGAI